MKELRLASKIIKILVKDRMYYPGRLFTDSIQILGRCGILLILYAYVYRLNNGMIHGSTFLVVAWSMFMYFTINAFRLYDISRAIMEDVQSGAVEMLLSKPISYLSYRMSWQVGSGLYSFCVISMVGGLILALTIGIPTHMLQLFFFLTFFLVFCFCIILALLLFSIVGLLSFWIEDVNPVQWIVAKTTMMLGGSFLPVALFPPLMKQIALYSPFGAAYFVSSTVYDGWSTNWFFYVKVQVVWMLILFPIAGLLCMKARKIVSVNGG